MMHSDSTSSTAQLRSAILRRNWLILELGGLISIWYMVFGGRWSGFVGPMGGEYARSMHSFYTWDYLRTCGECAWWSNIIGGYPNFAELFGSFVHPIAFINSMVWGAVAGSSMTVAMAFLLIMLAGWWFAYELKVHVIARVWYALAVMFGGHMMARLEIGSVGLPLSIASAWLFMVLLIGYIHTPSRVRALVLGMAGGALLLAGQGYLQLATALSLPLWAWYASTQGLFKRHPAVWRDAAWVAVIGVLIAAPIYVSSAMTSGLYEKEYDLSGQFNTSMTHILVNLLIDDFDVAKSDVYNNFAYPWAYSSYIGVTAFVFALAGYQWMTDTRLKRLYIAFFIFTVGALFVASGTPISWIISLQIESIAKLVGGLRYIILLNAFVALGMLSMAMLGIHSLLQKALLNLPASLERIAWIPVKSIIIAALLVSNVQSMWQFGKNWLVQADRYEPNVAAIVDDISALPFGYTDAPDWMTMALMSNNLKISHMFFSWKFVNYEYPTPAYKLSIDPQENVEVITQYEGGWTLYRNLDPAAVYAQVSYDDAASTPCQVDYAVAGMIDLTCTITQPGTLNVQEHDMPEWRATVNNRTVEPSVGTGWLTLALDAGPNVIQLRYQPWYVMPSLWAAVLGWALALGGIIWFSIKKTPYARA